MIVQLILFALTVYVFASFRSKKTSKLLPPGPPSWPIVGNVFELAIANKTFPHLALAKLASKYGDVMSLQLGVHPMVVLSSFESMKEVLTKSEALDRYTYPFVADRSFGKVEMGIVFNRGQCWKDVRMWSATTLKTFGFGKKRSMEMVLQEEAEMFVAQVEEPLGENGEGIWEIDFYSLVQNQTNIIWNYITGHRFPPNDTTLAAMVKLNDSVLEAVGITNRYMAFPWIKKVFPKWSQHESHMKSFTELLDFMQGVVTSIKNERDSSDGSEPRNFIEAFLDEMKKNEGNPDTIFTEEQLIVVINDLFLAGTVTKSSSIVLMIFYMTLNPTVQEKVFKEVKEVVGNRQVFLTDQPSMPYTKAATWEMLRHDVFIPLQAPREASCDISVQGYIIPKGTGIMWNYYPLYHDKKYWGDPEVYRPERFISQDSNGSQKLVNTERVSQTIFGFGRRTCLGQALAEDALFLTFATLMQHFKFSIIPGQEPDTTLIPSHILLPPPFSVQVSRR